MKRIVFGMLALAMAVAACQTGNNTAQSAQNVPFEVANGYFFRNDKAIPERPLVITSQEQLSEYFGCATTMSSRPTAIDFTTHAVIAVVVPPTSVSTDIVTKSITSEGTDTLVVNYSVNRGDSITYTMQPMAMMVIAKERLLNNVVGNAE